MTKKILHEVELAFRRQIDPNNTNEIWRVVQAIRSIKQEAVISIHELENILTRVATRHDKANDKWYEENS